MGRGTAAEGGGGGVIPPWLNAPPSALRAATSPFALRENGEDKGKGGPIARPASSVIANLENQSLRRFSGATVMRTVSPELPGKPVNIASTRLGTR